MIQIIRIALAFLLLTSAAFAQGAGQIESGRVWGNPTSGRALATQAPITAMLDRALTGGTTQGALATRNATVWIGLAPGTAGLPLLSGGAGANLAYGILGLSGGGCNAALTASNGGLLYSTATACAILAGTATAGQIPRSGSSAAPSWSTATYPATAAAGTVLSAASANVIAGTAAPVLGVPGSLIGTLGFAGNTSGTATITPQAAAGTPTLTLPTGSGTFAVSATSPLALSATTGALTCATCVTSSGGGAISGTAPVAVSAGGVVSITGLAGGVLAGASPAFTTTPVLGASGTLGTLGFGNATSGTVTLQPVAGALGTVTLTLPAATDTLAVLAASQAFTNKTYNGNTWTAGSGVLTIAASKTLTVSNTLTFTGTDSSSVAFGAGGTVTYTIASGAKALATGAIASATCTSAQTDTATNTATTDVVDASFNGDPTAVTGYVPLTTGMLTIIAYPTANTVNFKVCNNTSGSITPGAITLNWKVRR